MNELDFLASLGEIDDEFIEAANKKPRKKMIWNRGWIAAAACFMLLIPAIAFGIGRYSIPTFQHPNIAEFLLNDSVYEIPRVADGKQYGIALAENDDQYSVIETPEKTDLGDKMGTVVIVMKEKAVSCTVYHHAMFPDDDGICIVEMPDGYLVYYVRKDFES